MFGDVWSHVDEDEGFDACGLGHFASSDGAALAVCFAVFVHDFLVVPAHAEHDIGVTREFGDGVAWLGVAGENYGFSAFDVEAVCEGVEVGLDVFGGSGGYLPFVRGFDGAGSDVSGVYDGRFSGESAASVLMDFLAEGMADACDPVVSEDALFFVEDAVGDALGEGRAVDVYGVLFAYGLVPSAKEEAGVVDVVVEVVVGEEEVVDLGWPEAGLD